MTRTATPLHPTFVAALRRTLVTQREFRLEQLDQLDRQQDGRALSGVHREVHVSLAVGARTALQELESALWRIEQDRFGLCVTCGTELDVQVLETLPRTAHCPGCQRAAAGWRDRCADAPARARVSAYRRGRDGSV